ncbi:MAG: hypothetical protein EAX96_09855 [Candidatus Lokiarchaeota archaeon]|nr:hypothetical protein [Candidatus Lokiarchaeota archaeon]
MNDLKEENNNMMENSAKNLKNKNFFLISFVFFILLIINFWNETFVVSFIMQYKNYQGIGILGLNFTLEGGDLFFFFYNLLIITTIIAFYCLYKVFKKYDLTNREIINLKNEKLILYSKISSILIISLAIIEIINIIFRISSLFSYIDAGLLILHLILDLVFNISIIISFASFILIKIKLELIRD